MFQAEFVGGADPAGGEQHHVRGEGAPAFQMHHATFVGARFNLDDLLPEMHAQARVHDVVAKMHQGFLVHEIQHAFARLYQRDINVQHLEDGRVFHADHAGADDGERARKFFHAGDFVAVHDVDAVERHIIGAVGARADGDHETLGGKFQNFPVGRFYLQFFFAGETAVAAEDFHIVAHQLVFQNVHLAVQRHVQPLHQILGGDVLLDAVGAAVKTALAPAGQIQHGLAQGLAGDGAGVHAHAADFGHAVDDGDFALQFRRLNGRGFSGRAAADYHQIVFLHWGVPACAGCSVEFFGLHCKRFFGRNRRGFRRGARRRPFH